METQKNTNKHLSRFYRHIFEQYVDTASFYWQLRSLAVNRPDYFYVDLCAQDNRINYAIEGLMTAPDDSWDLCVAAMEAQQSGEAFISTIVAFLSLDPNKIQSVIQKGVVSQQEFKGLISAIGWLPGHFCHSWIKKFLTSNDCNLNYLAIAACSVRREDPQEFLNQILQRQHYVTHARLHARCLRLIGELKRLDLAGILRVDIISDNPDIAFWANWSAVLLGDKSNIDNLRSFVFEKGVNQIRAIELVFRALPVEIARKWISDLAQKPSQIRNVIKATANLGDPHAINWLIVKMQVPLLARLAGEAFTTISGIDIKENNLTWENATELEPFSDEQNIDMDEDENLPFPDVKKVIAIWQDHQNRFTPGQRYFIGKRITEDHILSIYSSGTQRQRRAAALELALLQPDQFLFNHAAKGFVNE